MRPYYGPRFYRLKLHKADHDTSVSYGDNRSLAVSNARNVYLPAGYKCILETIDDRYPANVLATEDITC